MYLRFARRRKDGKEHRYWSIVESRRCAGGRVVQRPVLYLGEINDGQREAWCRQIDAFDEASGRHRQLALFPADRTVPDHAKGFGVQVRLDAMELHRPRQWGACWLACHLYEQLELDRFFAPLLPSSREGTNWQHILQTLVCYRLIDPGSEWRLHRQWFEQSAMADLLGEDYGLVAKNALYRCLDKLLPHKAALFSHLRARWQDLFAAKFDVLLYDLTSTYFESPPPDDETDKRRHGYSRDKRSDCVQVMIALIVTPEGFPLGYEVLPGNTSDCTTLRGAHLRRLPGLLPARHPARPAQAAGARPHAESRARQVRSYPNARRAFPDHRRPHLDPQPLHRTHRRSENTGPPPQTRPSATAAATYYCARKDRSPPSQRRVVETFAMPALILFTFFAELGKLG
jgi:hypothetical protein